MAYRRALNKQEELCKAYAEDHPEHADCGKDLHKWAKVLEDTNALEGFRAGQLADDIAAGHLHLQTVSRVNNNFKNQVAEIKKGLCNAILIVMDYKESIKTGVPLLPQAKQKANPQRRVSPPDVEEGLAGAVAISAVLLAKISNK